MDKLYVLDYTLLATVYVIGAALICAATCLMIIFLSWLFRERP